MKSRSVKICKQLIWVYVVVLGVNENSNVLQQAALTEQEVIFQHAPPPCTQPKPTSSKNHLVPQSCSSEASSAQCNADRIIRRDPRSKGQPVWCLERFERKAGPKPHCAGCKKESFDTGDIGLVVDALYIPRDKVFCIDAQCFLKLPRF